MINLFRHYLLDGGYVYKDEKFTREPIEQFHMMQKELTYKLAPKLSMCLKMYGNNGSITAPDWINDSELCQLIDFNSDSMFSSISIPGLMEQT